MLGIDCLRHSNETHLYCFDFELVFSSKLGAFFPQFCYFEDFGVSNGYRYLFEIGD